MRIGVDFDNTIICYDEVFPAVARERGLIPIGLPESKGNVRDYLRKSGKEEAWTELQGFIYGNRLEEAKPFPGVLEFFRHCRRNRVPIFIVSHKTRYPYRGPEYDLHGAAYRWLEQRWFFDPDRIGISREQVFFEPTKEDKISRIARLGCTHFIDDLPEFLLEPALPPEVTRILFDPNGGHDPGYPFLRFRSWPDILRYFQELGG